jgi:hypothetical protein
VTSGSSVCVATYNGGRFLGRQLQSLCEQTQAAAEVVVVDDASTDNTIDEIESFRERAPFEVRLVRNRTRLGAVASFQRAVALAEGDLIFLCDQDDVWHPEKLERFAGKFQDWPTADGVFSDSTVFTDQPTDAGRSLFDLLGFPPDDRAASAAGIDVQLLLRRNVVSGHSLAFRASARHILLPFSSRLYHDAWIALLLAASGRLVVIDRPLVWHRQHEANLVGPRRVVSLATARSSMQKSQQELSRLASGYGEVSKRLATMETEVDPGVERALVLLREKVTHLELRASLDHRRVHRLRPVLRELRAGGYRRYSASPTAAFTDLFSVRADSAAAGRHAANRR